MSSLIKLDIMTARQHVLVEIARKMLSDFINRYHQCKQLDRTISASKIDSMYVLMFLFRLKDINFVA